MPTISVTQQSVNNKGWQFNVTISDQNSSTKHTVNLSKDYWQQLTGGQIPPEQLIEKSFNFLLARESKESILRSFDLPVIQTYFPDYETTIKQNIAPKNT